MTIDILLRFLLFLSSFLLFFILFFSFVFDFYLTPVMGSDEWEDSPTYHELLQAIYEFLYNHLNGLYPSPHETVERTYYNFCFADVFFVVFSSIAWTYFRQLATERLLKPLGRRCALTPSNQRKMPESAWKFGYYLSAWSFNCYILILSGNYDFFRKPSTVWDGWSLNESLPQNMYIFYIAQCGFYLHSLYATIFMDTWRKDSIIMIIHHTSTLVLIGLSLALKCHNIGCLVLFLHDVCDIFLESSKLNVYFKIQNNEVVQLHEILANVSFMCFTMTWYVSRLYWYPLRVIYIGISDINGLQSVLPCSLLMNSLLWVLQIMNIYWFYLILQTLYRVATGQLQEDAREYDVQEKLQEKKKDDSISRKKVENGGNAATNNGKKENGEPVDRDNQLKDYERKG